MQDLSIKQKILCSPRPGGGHWPRKGVWGCAALKTPFSRRVSCRSQGSHFKQKSQFTRPPFWKNLEILALIASIFTQILAHKPQIWKFSAHKPPNLEIFRSQAPLFRGKCQFASPTLRKSGPHTPTWKKVECPPRVPVPLVSPAVAVCGWCKLSPDLEPHTC